MADKDKIKIETKKKKTEECSSDDSDDDSDDELEPLERSLKNIIDNKTLRWIFVGGKGGVGKTTSSCSIACTLAKHRESVLIVSTDPAHNLSDAFGQKFTKDATKVNGFDNLYAMEIDPTLNLENTKLFKKGGSKMMSELINAIPGIDEAMSFAELMRHVNNMNYSTIVFDTAPTGHTLRLLSLPKILDNGFEKIMKLRNKFSGIMNQFSGMLGQMETKEEDVLNALDNIKQTVKNINKQFKDPSYTTFICVCIPEFLSLFETERLVQELTKFDIDTHNVIVNQVLIPEKDSKCSKCLARTKMQKKYLKHINELYSELFHVIFMPLLDEEVRGIEGLKKFGNLLTNPIKMYSLE